MSEVVNLTRKVGISEAKASFSELVNRVAYGGERVVITKHGKPVVQMEAVEASEEKDEERQHPDHWIWRAAGLCADAPEFCDILDEIVADRQNWMPREVPLFEDEDDDTA